MIETVIRSRLRRIRLAGAVLLGVAVVTLATARAGDEVFASVGTGELNGVYYPVGKAICEIVNRDLSTMASAARLKGRRDRSTTRVLSSPASWSLASSKPTSTLMLTKAKAHGPANHFSICDPCCRCIPRSSPSWLARILIFRIFLVWQAAGSMWAARVPASRRPGRPSKRNSAGATRSECDQWG